MTKAEKSSKFSLPDFDLRLEKEGAYHLFDSDSDSHFLIVREYACGRPNRYKVVARNDNNAEDDYRWNIIGRELPPADCKKVMRKYAKKYKKLRPFS